jgi:hypothetical protein
MNLSLFLVIVVSLIGRQIGLLAGWDSAKPSLSEAPGPTAIEARVGFWSKLDYMFQFFQDGRTGEHT